MHNSIATSILILILTGCQQTTQEPACIYKQKYLTVFRKGIRTDTLTKNLINLSFTDSVYNLTYVRELDSQSYNLPINSLTRMADDLDYKLIDKKEIYYEGDEPTNYIIYKFLLDDPKSHDEEMLLFFSPIFGIVIEKAAWGGNYGKLIENGNPEDKEQIFFLTEMIMFDSDFFHNWNPVNSR